MKNLRIIDNGIFEKSLQKTTNFNALTPLESLQIAGGVGATCQPDICGAKACGCDSSFCIWDNKKEV